MICHISLAIGLFNLGLVLHIVRKIEKRRAAVEATDRMLAAALKRPPQRPISRVSPD